MPAMNRTLALPRFCNLPITRSRQLSTIRDTHSNSFSSGYTAAYSPDEPTRGPLSKASVAGASRLTPSLLKEHLDKYVVGQDRAKKVTSVAIYNHYQRIRELQRHEAEEAVQREKAARRELREWERVEKDEDSRHIEAADLNQKPPPEPLLGSAELVDSKRTLIEKSNILLLGPSGVGKTYILSCLARVLEVPFATVDCSALTQAGYIGTDIESSIERLLLASGHDITKCETGIIFFDEVDKLAKPAIMTHGRDVSGEGVQQGLLKMIEGTTVTVNAKSDRSSKTEGKERMERGGRESGSGTGKSEQYTIDTTNILFVFAGAFVGLDRIISSRLSSGSTLGFGAKPKSSKLNKKQNVLERVTHPDLQTYGLIPELLGRIPITVPLSPLSLDQLVSILTEPRNSLVKQYIALFNTSGIQLRFSTGALHAIAERALPPKSSEVEKDRGLHGGGIGARGLRSIMESVLGEVMFRGPGSSVRHCLVDEKFVRDQARSIEEGDGKTIMPRCWSRAQGKAFEEALETEETAWRAKMYENERRERGETDEENSDLGVLRRVGSSGM